MNSRKSRQSFQSTRSFPSFKYRILAAVLAHACLFVGVPIYSQESEPAGAPTNTQTEAKTQPDTAAADGAEASTITKKTTTLGIAIQLPGARVAPLAEGLMLFGSILTVCGLGFLTATMVQKSNNAPQSTTFAALAAGFSGAGLGLILIGGASTTPYDQAAVPLD